MNKERMIAVSSDLIERAVSLLDLLPESGTIIELRAALATQPAAGEPEQQTAMNADDLPTKKYPLDAFDFDSPAAAPVASGEPVAPKEVGEVIVTLRDGMKCFAFEEYSEAYKLPEGLHYLYAAPPAAAHGETVAYRVIGDHGAPLTDWIDGNPGPDPVAMMVGGRYVQRAYAAAHGDEAASDLVPGLQWAIHYCNAMLRQGNERMLVEVIRKRLENVRDNQRAAMRAQGDGGEA